MAISKKHMSIAYGAAHTAREFWAKELRNPKLGRLFYMPKITVHPDTGELLSDMGTDGYPPRIKDKGLTR